MGLTRLMNAEDSVERSKPVATVGDWRGRLPKEAADTARHRRAQGEWRHRVLKWPAGPPTDKRVALNYPTLPNYLAPTHAGRDAIAERINLMSDAARTYAGERLPVIASLEGAAFEDRLFLNLLSSQPLAFSIAGELRSHREEAAALFAALTGRPVLALASLAGDESAVPDAVRSQPRYQPLSSYTLDGVDAEWFPPRWTHTGDRSGFDIAACLALPERRRLLVSIEVKYTDSFSSDKVTWKRYAPQLEEIGLTQETLPALVSAGCSQVLRQVMITESVRRHGIAPGVGESGRVDDVIAVVLAREDDWHAREVAEMVNDAASVEVAFWSHKQAFKAAAQQTVWGGRAGWAGRMVDRYVPGSLSECCGN